MLELIKTDSLLLNEAIKQKDNKSIISIIGRRSNEHIQGIREEYKNIFENDLLRDLESTSTFYYKDLLFSLVKSKDEIHMEDLFHAIKGSKKKEKIMIEILLTNEKRDTIKLSEMFKREHNKSLKTYIKRKFSGDFKKLLLKCLETKRSLVINEKMIDEDVERLYKAGEARLGTNEDVFIEILVSRSFPHLELVSEKYKDKHKHSLGQAIKYETSGWFRRGLLACVEREKYWAMKMNKAVKQLGKNDELLKRCFAEFSNKHLMSRVEQQYKKLFFGTIYNDIRGDSCGDYRELMCTLLDFSESEKQFY